MEREVVVIGGANTDILGKSKNPLIFKDSNPGEISFSFGGVGRNIAENLGRLGAGVTLISAFGDDFFGKKLESHTSEFMDTTNCYQGGDTSIYLTVATEEGEMAVAINQMDIFKNLTVDFMKDKIPLINSHKIAVLDTNLEEETLEFLLNEIKIPVFVDAVSVTKCGKIKNHLSKISILKPNALELEALSGEKDLEKGAQAILSKGTDKLFITLGEKGSLAMTKMEKHYLPTFATNLVSTTGAGDSFVAGMTYGLLHGKSLKECQILGSLSSKITISSVDTISKDMSESILLNLFEKEMNKNP